MDEHSENVEANNIEWTRVRDTTARSGRPAYMASCVLRSHTIRNLGLFIYTSREI